MKTLPIFFISLLVVFALFALSPPAYGVGGDTCVAITCSAPAPSCRQMTTSGTDNCGNSCTKSFGSEVCSAATPTCGQTTRGTRTCGGTCFKTGPSCCVATTCSAAAPSCSQRRTVGTDNCGGRCSRSFSNICSAATPACGQRTTGTWTCGGTCSRTGGSCYSWQPYGFAVPGDPQYSFGLPANKTKTFLGLAAQGNIVIGDYTTGQFESKVVSLLGRGSQSITQPYVVDPADTALGYRDYNDNKGRPVFSGDYNRSDGGRKTDSSPRDFYESSLPDSDFQALVASNLNTPSAAVKLDATLFTNHALAGLVTARDLTINGTLVARDDGLIFGRNLTINHDARLTDPQSFARFGLPMSIKRPQLQSWQECSESSPCP